MIKVGLVLSVSAVIASAWFSMPSMSVSYGDSKNIDNNYERDAQKEVVINKTTSKMYSDKLTSKKMHFFAAWQYCQEMDLAGHKDWRVITKDEAKGLLELSRPKITIKHAFRNVKEETYWTATQDRYDQAWYVDFDLGRYSTKKQTYNYRVMCVRDMK